MLLQKSFFTGALVSALVILLTACSPKFDWRQARLDAHGVIALLPGKPALLERSINLAGSTVKMSMMGAKVDDLSFTVAAAPLPVTSSASPVTSSYLEAMQQQMLRNIGAPSSAATPVQVGLVDAAGKPVGQTAASMIKAQGKLGTRDVTMRAVFCKNGNRLIQAVVLGSPWNEEVAQQFFDSFKIEQQP
jgi:hypothetical protein